MGILLVSSDRFPVDKFEASFLNQKNWGADPFPGYDSVNSEKTLGENPYTRCCPGQKRESTSYPKKKA